MRARIRLGLTGALALLAACGPTKPTQEAGDDNGDDNDDADDGADESEGNEAAATEDDTGSPEATCTFENYANDPQLLEFTELGCFPVGADGTCPECDLECMDAIVYQCPINGCGQPDFPCSNECGNHLVLCSEQLGDQCCYLVTAEYSGGIPGRPLRERGIPQLPNVTIIGAECDDLDRRRAADGYREFARYERASVDAFLRAAVILEQLGAPSELIERHRDAAREEAGHARLALAAAQALDGRSATLDELPAAAIGFDLPSFVRDLIHDGCINELIAAREAEWALAQACVREHEPLLGYWTAVIDEETGHAELAWRVLEWLLSTRPEIVGFVVAELGAAIRPRAPIAVAHGDVFGLPAMATKVELRELAIDELIADAHAHLEYRS